MLNLAPHLMMFLFLLRSMRPLQRGGGGEDGGEGGLPCKRDWDACQKIWGGDQSGCGSRFFFFTPKIYLL